MDKRNFHIPERQLAHADLSARAVTTALGVIEETSNLLEDTWEIPIKKLVVFNGWATYAQPSTKKINIGLDCIAYSSAFGYKEYATCQYLIGIKHRRGARTRSKKIKSVTDVTKAIVAHEYAHLVTPKKYFHSYYHEVHKKLPWHGIEFQMVYAEMLDQIFPNFGAVDRLFKKWADKVEQVWERMDI